MAAQVYSTPEGMDEPEFNDFLSGSRFDNEGYFRACDAHRALVAAWCREHSSSKSALVGKTIGFPVADGTAEYMVYTTKPLALIHLAYVDGYEADPILLRGLRVADVEKLVGRGEALSKLFGSSRRSA